MAAAASLIVKPFPVVRKMLAADTSRNSVLSLQKYVRKNLGKIPRIVSSLSPFLRIATFQVQFESTLGINTMSLPREKWDTWDPTLISEVRRQSLFVVHVVT